MFLIIFFFLFINLNQSIIIKDYQQTTPIQNGISIMDAGKFYDSLFLIVLNKNRDWYVTNDENLFMESLQENLLLDNCVLLKSSITKEQTILKIYCNYTSPSISPPNNEEEEEDEGNNNEENKILISKNKNKKVPKLNNTLIGAINNYFNLNDIIIEKNEIIRKPKNWYGNSYHTNKLIDIYLQNKDKHKKGEIFKEDFENEYNYYFSKQKLKEKLHDLNFFESNPTWGLDRIDQRFGALDNEYEYMNLGQDIDICIIDTGIRLTHTQFQGRAHFLANTIGGNNDDNNGHGSHCAGIAASITYGVSKGSQLYAVKALGDDGSGDSFSIAAGIQAVIEFAQINTSRRVVVNLSIGGSKSNILDNAVLSLVQNNIFVSVAAGNSNADACNFSPSDLGGLNNNNFVLSVGASDINDNDASFSNYGPCVSIGAPGVNILSVSIASDTATVMLSGTSMASPFVAGVGALVLQQNLGLTVQQVNQKILSWNTFNIINYASRSGGGKNLLYSLIDVTQPSPPTQPPSFNIPFHNNGYNIKTNLLILLIFILLYFI